MYEHTLEGTLQHVRCISSFLPDRPWTTKKMSLSFPGFLIVAVSGHEMPRYAALKPDSTGSGEPDKADAAGSEELEKPDTTGSGEQEKPEPNVSDQPGSQEFTQVRFWKTTLFMVYIYYTISCGLEAFFQVRSCKAFPFPH